jgi:hypothetical protein
MTVLSTGTKVPTAMLREMMKPLYPPGTSLDWSLIFNFVVKVRRMMANKPEGYSTATITSSEESDLLSTVDDVSTQSPAFLTEALSQFNQLLEQSMHDKNDLAQIQTYLELLSASDRTFAYRVGRSEDGSITGFVWQTGVMRRDFELYGDVLFVDCLGRSLNTKGWPINTLAMKDGEKKICLPCEGFTIGESVLAYAWLIQSTVSMAPNRSLKEIKIICSDGILSGETILSRLGIHSTCNIVLDHYHLISEDIGIWPKFFGSQLWPSLRGDLGLMVKSTDRSIYDLSYGRLKVLLSSKPIERSPIFFSTTSVISSFMASVEG